MNECFMLVGSDLSVEPISEDVHVQYVDEIYGTRAVNQAD